MESPTRLATFEDYRQRMESIMTLAEASITSGPPADTAALDNGRIRMARVITAYHLFAEREVFTPCLYALRDPAHKAQIKAIAAECASLSNDFRRWTRECQESPVVDRWASYRPVALAMMARIRRHLAAAAREVQRCQTLGITLGVCRAAA